MERKVGEEGTERGERKDGGRMRKEPRSWKKKKKRVERPSCQAEGGGGPAEGGELQAAPGEDPCRLLPNRAQGGEDPCRLLPH